MEKPVTFKLVKLTNNKSTEHTDQVLYSYKWEGVRGLRVHTTNCLFTKFNTTFIIFHISPLLDHSQLHAAVSALPAYYLPKRWCHTVIHLQRDKVYCSHCIPEQQGND